ncbi:hypothetical protein C0J52_22082 [Blattella germanica]|nr:hypothetical protein C0J52_22082 [Blattella germanica]
MKKMTERNADFLFMSEFAEAACNLHSYPVTSLVALFHHLTRNSKRCNHFLLLQDNVNKSFKLLRNLGTTPEGSVCTVDVKGWCGGECFVAGFKSSQFRAVKGLLTTKPGVPEAWKGLALRVLNKALCYKMKN